MTKTIYVSSDQIDAARTLIRLRGGEDKVDPVIVRIAHAEEPQPSDKRATGRRAS